MAVSRRFRLTAALYLHFVPYSSVHSRGRGAGRLTVLWACARGRELRYVCRYTELTLVARACCSVVLVIEAAARVAIRSFSQIMHLEGCGAGHPTAPLFGVTIRRFSSLLTLILPYPRATNSPSPSSR